MYGSHDVLNYLALNASQLWAVFKNSLQAADWKNAERLPQEIYLRYFADVLSV